MEYTTFETVKGRRTNIACPDYVDSSKLNLPPNAVKVLEKRYLRRDATGNFMETPAGMFYRVARHVASAGNPWMDGDELTKCFYDLMTERRFYPNSPTFTGAATPMGQLAACFVLKIEDDMGSHPEGIFSTLRTAALIQQTGGGNGFSFSRLRPKGDSIASTGGQASGPVGFMKVFDAAFGEVLQGGVRRGANMAVLRVDHPDIEEFIECKAKEGTLTNFNVSVGITDSFMRAVRAKGDFDLINPRTGKVVRRIHAPTLFDKIVEYAHHNGEPGVLFLDVANRDNPVPHLYELEATNPCGEQFLGPYENCCLGSINLAEHVDPSGVINWDLLARTVKDSTCFLDNVVTVNAYVPAVPEIRNAAMRARRIGLGIMGLADLFYKMGIRYGSSDSLGLASKIMEFIRYHAMQTSISLAHELGPFEAIEGSIYGQTTPDGLPWQAPIPQVVHASDWGCPVLDWSKIEDGIMRHGIRNAAQTTIAPTGTIATVCGVEGYGCEPVFALGYIRHVKDGDKDVELTYTSPLFEAALWRHEADPPENTPLLTPPDVNAILEYVARHGSLDGCPVRIPNHLYRTFVVSSDITAVEHVNIQGALQAFVDNSLSKTCNFPATATRADVADAYMRAWSLDCKGLTVYVTGSREQVVLETKATQEKKINLADLEAELKTAPGIFVPSAVTGEGFRETYSINEPIKVPRPNWLRGTTYRKETPLGKAYITVNSDERNEPFEVFLNVGKAGSETSAVSEAIGRLLSLMLRLPATIAPARRLGMAIDELIDIGGGRHLGFGNKRVKSLPDGIAQVLRDYLMEVEPVSPEAPLGFHAIGDICPDCGEATLLNVEGCRKCQGCGYSEC